MKRYLLSALLLAVIAIVSIGCAAGEVSGASNDTPEGSADSSQSSSVNDKAGLVQALEAAGAKVESGTRVEQAFFSVPGEILKVNGADVQVFEYDSEEAMGTEASQVSQDGGSIGTSMVTWMEAPHFFRSGRLLVLYVGEEAAILDLLESVLGEQFAGR